MESQLTFFPITVFPQTLSDQSQSNSGNTRTADDCIRCSQNALLLMFFNHLLCNWWMKITMLGFFICHISFIWIRPLLILSRNHRSGCLVVIVQRETTGASSGHDRNVSMRQIKCVISECDGCLLYFQYHLNRSSISEMWCLMSVCACDGQSERKKNMKERFYNVSRLQKCMRESLVKVIFHLTVKNEVKKSVISH